MWGLPGFMQLKKIRDTHACIQIPAAPKEDWFGGDDDDVNGPSQSRPRRIRRARSDPTNRQIVEVTLPAVGEAPARVVQLLRAKHIDAPIRCASTPDNVDFVCDFMMQHGGTLANFEENPQYQRCAQSSDGVHEWERRGVRKQFTKVDKEKYKLIEPSKRGRKHRKTRHGESECLDAAEFSSAASCTPAEDASVDGDE